MSFKKGQKIEIFGCKYKLMDSHEELHNRITVGNKCYFLSAQLFKLKRNIEENKN